MRRPVVLSLTAIFFSGMMFAQTPTIGANGVVNAASFDNRLCPGLVAAVFGTNFGTSKTGVTVTVSGKPGFLINVTSTQLAFQIPFEVSPGPASVVVTTPAGSSAAANITLLAYAPALLSADSSGAGLFFDASNKPINAASPAAPGQTIAVSGLGFGQTNPASGTGVAPSGAAPTTSTVTLTVNGEQAKVAYAGVAPNAAGAYQINFTVPSDLATGNFPVIAMIGGQSSNTVTLAVTSSVPAGTTPTITSLDNGASFAPKSTAAPGTFLTLKGTNFGSADSLGVYPATAANGVSVTINGIAAPLFDVIASGNQINLLAPSELPSTGTVPVQVKTANGSSSFFTLTMTSTVPAMFALTDPSKPSRRNAVAVDSSTTWIAMPISMAEAIAKSIGLPADCTGPNPAAYCGRPAAPGDTITLYATGLGVATPGGDPAGQPLPTGQLAPTDGSVTYSTIAAPVVSIGGASAQVMSSVIARASREFTRSACRYRPLRPPVMTRRSRSRSRALRPIQPPSRSTTESGA
jgi:uncharacterized protein (TIGR03437 family)